MKTVQNSKPTRAETFIALRLETKRLKAAGDPHPMATVGKEWQRRGTFYVRGLIDSQNRAAGRA